MLGRKEKPEFEDAKGGKVEEDSMVSSKRLDVAESCLTWAIYFRRHSKVQEEWKIICKVFEEAAQTVDIIPAERQSIAACLKILGAILSTKEKAFGGDQEEAIRSMQASVTTTPPDPDLVSQPDRLSALWNPGSSRVE
jgi:hypothetical protein